MIATKTLTLTRAEAMALTLPGSISGLLREGAPVRWGRATLTTWWITRAGDPFYAEPNAVGVHPAYVGWYSAGHLDYGLHLQMSLRAGLSVAVDWLGEGGRCIGPDDDAQESCDRRPHDLLWALHRDVDPAVAVVVAWASVVRVLAGLSPVGRVFHRAFPLAGIAVIAGPDVPDAGPTRMSRAHIILDGTGDDLRITVEVPRG